MTLIEQIKLGESKTLEFKRELPTNADIAKTAIAFSNTAGGKLLIGVDDRGAIKGVDENELQAMQEKIISIISDRCSPTILPEFSTLNIQGKILLVVEFFRGNLLPYSLKNTPKEEGIYIRIGSSNRLASPQYITELERQRNNTSFDEEINLNFPLSSLELTPLLREFESIGKPLDESKLLALKLIKPYANTLYPTNALLILLGKFEHCTLKCARFKGTTMDIFIDKKEYDGDIFSILQNTQNFILNHLNISSHFEGMYRRDSYEIPQIALREALINALIHRDYTNAGRDIKVGIYDDILNIVSPGGLPNTITLEDIQNGRSEARNKVIARVFKELGLIEQWGSGIGRIKNSCTQAGLQLPKIEEKGDSVDVEIFRPQDKTNEVKESKGER